MLTKHTQYKFFTISFMWAATFPIVKFVRMHDIHVWQVCFYQCFFSFGLMALIENKHLLPKLKTLNALEIKYLLMVTILRNLIGIGILNYLLLSQSVTHVTISLLLIPFATLLIEVLHTNYRLNVSQGIGMFLSVICVFSLFSIFNYNEKIDIFFLPITLLASLAFGLEAIVIRKIDLKPTVILFFQNLVGSMIFLICLIAFCLISNKLSTPILPLTLCNLMILVSSLSLFANYLFIQLTKSTGASISTQINIFIVILSCLYDSTFSGINSLLENIVPLMTGIASIHFILKKSDRQVKQHT